MRFLQGGIELIVQVIFEDLPGSKSFVFHDVPAVSWAILLPNLPPCLILSPSSAQYLAVPAPLASSPTRTLYPATSSSSSTTCLSRPSSQPGVFSSSSSSSYPPTPSASQPLDFLSCFLVYSKLFKAADALLHL